MSLYYYHNKVFFGLLSHFFHYFCQHFLDLSHLNQHIFSLVYLYYCVIPYLVGGNEINPIGNNPGEAPFLCASTAL